MLLSLAGSMQQPPAVASPRNDVASRDVGALAALRPASPGAGVRLTAVATLPVAEVAAETQGRRIAASDFLVLFEAQARADRDDQLRRLGVREANRVFDAVLRETGGDGERDATLLRNGIVTLKLRSEQEVRLARQIYERYQLSSLVGATPEEVADLERRFARLAGWPPLPPITVAEAQGGSLRGLASAIAFLEERIEGKAAPPG